MFKLNLRVDKIRVVAAFFCGISLLAITACTQTTSDTRAADEKTLRELDGEWSKTAEARNLDGTVAFYADDAVVMPGDAPIANTKQTIREAWTPLMAPNASVSWQANQAEVARSGDIGYARGVYRLVMGDAAGKTTTEHGKFLEVWKKQADGKWKCAVDSFSADAPAPVVEKK